MGEPLLGLPFEICVHVLGVHAMVASPLGSGFLLPAQGFVKLLDGQVKGGLLKGL